MLYAGTAAASADAWSNLTTAQQEGMIDGEYELAGDARFTWPFQDAQVFGYADAFAEAEMGQGAYANAFTSVIQDLWNSGGATPTETAEAEMETTVRAGFTNLPTADVTGVSDADLLAELLPGELTAPGIGTAAAVATGVVALGAFLYETFDGPPVTYFAMNLDGIVLCSNSELAIENQPNGIYPSTAGGTIDCDPDPSPGVINPPTSQDLYQPGGLYSCVMAPNPTAGQWTQTLSPIGGNAECVPGTTDNTGAIAPGGTTPLLFSSVTGAPAAVYVAEQVTGPSSTGQAGELQNWGYVNHECAPQINALDPPYEELVSAQTYCTDSQGVQLKSSTYTYVEPQSDIQPQGLATGTAPIGVPVTHIGVATSTPPESQVAAALQGAVDDTGGVAQTMSGLVGVMSTAPAQELVPGCDYSLYPEQEGQCVTQLESVGLAPVVLPASDPVCQASSYCASGSGDSAGTVEGLSTSDTTYTEAGDGMYLAVGTTVYVYAVAGGGLTAPDCTGLSVAACEQQFAAAGFAGTPTVTWEDGSPTSTPAGFVITQNPGKGAEVTTESADEPLELGGAGEELPAPEDDELQVAYSTTLANDGFGNVTTTQLTPETLDPFLDPGAVVQVTPAPGTFWDPANLPAVNVYYNPTATPGTGPTSGPTNPPGQTGPTPDPFTGPTVDPNGIHFPSIPTPCNVFPFGVPCWIANQLSVFTASPVAPSATFHSVKFGNQPLTIDLSNVDGADLSSVMEYVRPILVLITLVVFITWLANRPPPGFDTNDPGEQGALF